MLGQKNEIMGQQQKYLLFGDGQSPHTLKWVKELQKFFDVYVVSSQGFIPELDQLLQQDKKFSLEVNMKMRQTSIGFFSKFSALKNIIEKIQPNFVNAHYISSHGLLIAILKTISRTNFTFIASAWGTDVLVFPWRNKLFFYSIKYVLSKADWVTSDSDYMTQVIQKIRKSKVLTFTFGLDRRVRQCAIEQ